MAGEEERCCAADVVGLQACRRRTASVVALPFLANFLAARSFTLFLSGLEDYLYKYSRVACLFVIDDSLIGEVTTFFSLAGKMRAF